MAPGDRDHLLGVAGFDQREHKLPADLEQLFAAVAVFEQFAEPAAGVVKALAQQRDLVFHQRNRLAGLMRQSELGHERLVVEEKLRVGPQPGGNLVPGQFKSFIASLFGLGGRVLVHSFTVPS